ncbi:MAG: chromate transporter [Chloroflexi bacterium]|nr:chromate transporter [Chloroflexota bacterium]
MTSETVDSIEQEPKVERSRIQKVLLLAKIYFKVMAFAFTGGLAAMPILLFEISQKHKLIPEDEYMDIVALSTSMPGIIGVNNAMLTGMRIAGPQGAFAAVFSTVMPAYLSMVVVVFLFQQLPRSAVVMGAINGIRAVSVAILLDTGIRNFLRFRKDAFAMFMFVLALCLPLLGLLSAFYTILLMGAIGIIAYLINQYRSSKELDKTKKESDE